jgi:hypothetical protein
MNVNTAKILPSNYHEMSEDDQVSYWSAYIYRGMRWAGEDGYDEISILDRKELVKWKTLDPTIERLLPKVLESLAVMWQQPKDAFISRVNKQMGLQPSNSTIDKSQPSNDEILNSTATEINNKKNNIKYWWKFWI